jgi:hypothetical protein
MPKNLDFFSFVKARDAQKNVGAMGGDFSAFLTRVGLLEESVSTLKTTVDNQFLMQHNTQLQPIARKKNGFNECNNNL